MSLHLLGAKSPNDPAWYTRKLGGVPVWGYGAVVAVLGGVGVILRRLVR